VSRPDNFWHAQGATRLEQVFGDRLESCFAQRPLSLHQMLATAAEQHGARCALVCGSERLSFAQLLQASAELAAGMAHAGVQAGDRVAIHTPGGGGWGPFIRPEDLGADAYADNS
jgi:non-ribosomal peptide synthetase component E (peptide arylation enzyme)